MATATPAMLPMPTVPETAVVNAWKWEISPGSSSLAKRPLTSRMAWPKPRMFTKRRYRVKKRPAADQPDDDQGQIRITDWHGEKDEAGHRVGDGPHGLIDESHPYAGGFR